MSKVVNVSHGGSRRGQGSIVPWGDQCLIKMDILQLQEDNRLCAESLEDLDNSPWFLLGTLYHHYMEEYFLYGNEERLVFKDRKCGYDPGQDFQDEAYRLFEHMLPILKEQVGKPVYVEFDLDGDFMMETFGVDVTGRLDGIFERDDGLYIIDHKTASRTASTKKYPKADYNKYVYKDSFFQRVVYTHGAIAAGIKDIKGFEFWRIVKTKEPQFEKHEAHWVSEKEKNIVADYLQSCEEKRENYDRLPIITQCKDCEFKFDGQCPVWND